MSKPIFIYTIAGLLFVVLYIIVTVVVITSIESANRKSSSSITYPIYANISLPDTFVISSVNG